MATIQITLEDGQLTWTTDSLDAKEALWLMTDTLMDMYNYFYKSPLRPIMNPQAARVV